jgi:hypothetical protein
MVQVSTMMSIKEYCVTFIAIENALVIQLVHTANQEQLDPISHMRSTYARFVVSSFSGLVDSLGTKNCLRKKT